MALPFKNVSNGAIIPLKYIKWSATEKLDNIRDYK